MRHSWPFRLFAAFMACWLALSIAEPVTLHACPMHDLVVGAGAMQTTMHHGQHGGMGGDMDGAMSHGADHQHHGGQCFCLGACAASAPVALGAANLQLAALTTSATRDAGLPDHSYRPVERAHRLPFANAPPTA